MKVVLDGYGEVQVAATFRERWRGLRGTPPESALLLRSRSVHGIGMDRPVLAVALDHSKTVIESRVLRPGRVVLFRRARWVLELPADIQPPAPGTRLTSDG